MGMFSGPWTWRRLKSFTYLAVAFNKRQLRRLFLGRRDDGGLPRFLENFSAEGMTPLDAGQTAHVLALTRCTYCGLCEAVCPHPLDRWPAFARALEHSRHAAADLPPSCPPECRQCEAICPTGVPLREIPAFVRRQ
jgi:ferredoxin